MSSTKNTKDNRQVVMATYHAPESIFEIPDGLDLEDKSVVEYWEVKYNELTIVYVNGKEETIAPTWDAADNQFKHPKECEILPAKDIPYEYEEDLAPPAKRHC